MSQFAVYRQGLGFGVADGADAHFALHFFDVILEFGSEGCVADGVDGPVEPLLSIHAQTAVLGSQVRMVIYSEEQVHYAVFF